MPRTRVEESKTWTTKEGKKIKIKDMEDSHLLNTIAMLERLLKQKEAQAITDGYWMLGFLNGEMALESVENNLNHLEEEGLDIIDEFPIYEHLQNEAIKRGLL